MFAFTDLFQWDRFITPSIIKVFYWLSVVLAVLFGLSGLVSAVTLMGTSVVAGLLALLGTLLGMLIAIVAARIAAELVLIVFRINEHLGAIRNRGGL
ncbi:hypothetical protein RHODGE_RHODGE_03569 [Rhodoplanes serenus]|uniref:DUF4282 domain-containing protein n=1 Tax=Rhodoplanes serenus TaxID=200615 RepID=A0A3S4FBI0_9BRAD|nr:DUF4282 domain-containing protein [Rhodoplanes serenus]VCU10379.1 hypothetical protein RHODGE_RHODGE_03569 [Rhodoplanes serenus]